MYPNPYAGGVGRTARLLHLWYLSRRGFRAAARLPLSLYITEARAAYYGAFSLVRRSAELSGVTDATAFLSFFTKHVYAKLREPRRGTERAERFAALLRDGKITAKERELWNFVTSFYDDEEFSTKQLELDFRRAAYATIRSFVRRFVTFGLLTEVRYTNKSRYRLL